MKRAIFLLLVLLIVLLGVIVVRRYPDFVPAAPPPTITPVAFLVEVVPTPVLVPTQEATVRAARSIPLPARIPTLDLVKDLVTSNTPATLELTNDWNSVITLDFEGFKVTVSPGQTEKRQFPPGSYKYAASTSNCGSPQTSTITLEANRAYSIRLYCSSTGVFGDQPGTDYAIFEVRNDLKSTITLSISGRTYQVPPGTMEIRLAPGSYTYSASAPGVSGTTSKSITLHARERTRVRFYTY